MKKRRLKKAEQKICLGLPLRPREIEALFRKRLIWIPRDCHVEPLNVGSSADFSAFNKAMIALMGRGLRIPYITPAIP